ncbi:MAG TPA: hypothetical protein VLT33_30780 [Labilithrix sp.]|nr:hypothetical protein [Labilithrix sp.]
MRLLFLAIARHLPLLALASAPPLVLLACSSTTIVASSPSGGEAGADDSGHDPEPATPDAGEPPPPAAVPLELAKGLSASCLAADETAVYACVSGAVRKIPVDGSATSVLWTAPSGELVSQLVRAGQRLFATTSARLHVVGTDGSGSADLHTGSRLHRSLTWSSGYVFTLDGTSIVSVPEAGGAAKKGAYDFPTYVRGGGGYAWLVEGDESSSGFDITVLDATTMKSALNFSIGNQGASGAKLRHDRLASDGTRMYTGSAKAVSNRVEIEEYDNPPVGTANGGIVSRHLGDLTAYAVADLAADETGLVVATNESIYRYDRTAAKFVVVTKGSPADRLAITKRYVFWLDGDTLRGTPR